MIASDGRRVNIAALSCRSYEAVKQMVYRIRTAQAQRNKRNPAVTSINQHSYSQLRAGRARVARPVAE